MTGRGYNPSRDMEPAYAEAEAARGAEPAFAGDASTPGAERVCVEDGALPDAACPRGRGEPLREPARPRFPEGRAELEALIAAAAPGRDAAGDVARLCEAFSSPAAAMEAEPQEVCMLGGLPASLALTVSLVPALARLRQRERSFSSGPMRTAAQAGALLRAMYFGERYESCCLLSLRNDGTPLRVDRVTGGTIDETPFYCRLAVDAALASGGEAFVFAHNHPGGTAFASGADVQSTGRLMRALHALSLTLLDHLIIAGSRVVSLREDRLPSSGDWLRCAPLPPAFAAWLGG